MADIKPIETLYNGYRFRSRLEARWAVFFDAANIEYRYEIEGFNLGNNKYYLPDFYLPMFHMYVEVKPSYMDIAKKNEALEKLERLFGGEIFGNEGDGIVTAIFFGDPLEDDKWVYCNYSDDEGGGCGWFKFDFVSGAYGEYNGKKYCFKSNEIIAIVKGGMDDFLYESSGHDGNARLVNALEIKGYCSDFKNAKAIARQSRFEHRGE